MSTILWVIGMVLLGILALTVFGMTITKKDYEDYEDLSRYVDESDDFDREAALAEWHRLFDGGRVPTDEMWNLRARIARRGR